MSRIQDQLNKLSEDVASMKSQLANQIMDEDILSREAILDILVVNGIVTPQEIQTALDKYANFTLAIIYILVEKGVCTKKDFNCHIMAAHHMIRKYGAGKHISNEEWFRERIAYAKELAKMENPIEVI